MLGMVRRNMDLIYQDDQHSNAIWLGNIFSACNIQIFKPRNIKTVITVAQGLNLKYQHDIKHLVYNAKDMPSYNIKKHFIQSFYDIQNGLKKGSVLIHCAAGVSRSASILIAYLMKKLGINLKKAFQLVKNKRQIISPNPGFLKCLQVYDNQLKKNRTIKETNKKKSSDQIKLIQNKKKMQINKNKKESSIKKLSIPLIDFYYNQKKKKNKQYIVRLINKYKK